MKMILPDDVLMIIKEFSRPFGLRLDWRQCKRKESGRIKGSNLALLLWYKWGLGRHPRHSVHPLYQEIQDWTFYGRRHLIYESKFRFWTQAPDRDDEWYEKRFRMIDDGFHQNMAFQVEVHMANVSLIV